MGQYWSDKYFGTGNNYRLRHEVHTTPNDSTWQSSLMGQAWIVSNPTYRINSSATKSGTFKMAGSSWSYSHVFGNWGGGGWRKIGGDFNKTVTHNSAGEYSLTIGGSFSINVTLSGTYWGTITLDDKTHSIEKVEGGFMHVKVGGSWRTGRAYVKVSGSWRPAKRVYVKVSGSWRPSK